MAPRVALRQRADGGQDGPPEKGGLPVLTKEDEGLAAPVGEEEVGGDHLGALPRRVGEHQD